MANPYHDAAGKFCSKGEMKAAIDSLASEGKLDAYFTLRKEYEDIENGTVTVSQSVIKAVPSHNPAFAKLTNPDEIRGVFEVIKDDQEKYSGNILHILSNPHSPEDVKEEIARTASDKIRLEAIKQFNNPANPANSEDVKALAAHTNNLEILQHVVSSPKLSFEDRYIIAKTYDEGLNDLARSSRSAFFNEPELVKEFQDKARSLVAKDNRGQDYLNTLAQYAHDDESHQLVLDSGRQHGSLGNPLYNLSQNPSISIDTGYALVEKIQKNDVMSYRDIYQNAVASMKQNPNNRPIKATPYPWSAPTLIKGKAPEKLEELLSDWEKDPNNHNRANVETLQAAIDSHSDNNNRLEKNMKYLRRHPNEKVDGATSQETARRLHASERYREASYLTQDLKRKIYG